MDWGLFELDPEYLWLYITATVLSTIGFVIMFRESRARKREMEEAKAAIEAEDAARKALQAHQTKAKKKRHH